MIPSVAQIIVILLAVLTLNASVAVLILMGAWRRWQAAQGWRITIEEIDDAFDWEAAEAQMREGPSVDHA